MKFAILQDRLKYEDEIGFGFLVAEDEEGNYEPVELVSTISEASEVAASDMRRRLRLLSEDKDTGLCPYEYKLFGRTINGRYELIGSALVATQEESWPFAR